MSGMFSLLVLSSVASSEEELLNRLAVAAAEAKETKKYDKVVFSAYMFLIKQAVGDDFHKAVEMIEDAENPVSILKMSIKTRTCMDDESDECEKPKKNKKKKWSEDSED